MIKDKMYTVIIKDRPFNFEGDLINNSFSIDLFGEKELVEFINENNIMNNMSLLVLCELTVLTIPEVENIIGRNYRYGK